VSQEGTGSEGRGGGEGNDRKGREESDILERSGGDKKDEEFWEYVKEYDFVSLEEIWVDRKSWEKLRD